jgi:hypothetical protein
MNRCLRRTSSRTRTASVHNSLRRGMRGVSDNSAVGIYSDLPDPNAEYPRKVRTVTRGLRSLGRNLGFLNPFAHGVAAWQLFSHKLCRWLVPFAMIGMLGANAMLALRSVPYLVAGVVQLLCYLLAALGFVRLSQLPRLLRLLSFFVLVNISIVNAWWNVLRGRKVVTWQPSSR